MKTTYRRLLLVLMTQMLVIVSIREVRADTNQVGNCRANNISVVTNTVKATSSVTGTNLTGEAYHSYMRSLFEKQEQQQMNENFFGVHFMDFLMNTVDFDSVDAEGGRYGIDTAMLRIFELRKSLYLGPFYDSKYPITQVGPGTNAGAIGLMLRLTL